MEWGLIEVRSLVKRPLAKVATEMRLASFHWPLTSRSRPNASQIHYSLVEYILLIHSNVSLSSIVVTMLVFTCYCQCCSAVVDQVHWEMPGLMSCVTFKRRSGTRKYRESFALLISSCSTRHGQIMKAQKHGEYPCLNAHCPFMFCVLFSSSKAAISWRVFQPIDP